MQASPSRALPTQPRPDDRPRTGPPPEVEPDEPIMDTDEYSLIAEDGEMISVDLDLIDALKGMYYFG